MPESNSNGISIGENQWLVFDEIDSRPPYQDVSIDHLITPLDSFWSALETDCVADCCGIDAFSFWPDAIAKACQSHDREEIASGLASLHEFIEQSTGDLFGSSRLNSHLPKYMILKLIEHIQKHVALPKSA